MNIRTRWVVDFAARDIWPLLLESCSGPASIPIQLCFHLGLPRPIACSTWSTPDVGHVRQYALEGGTMEQEITEVLRERRLGFKTINAFDHAGEPMAFFAPIASMHDTFTLYPVSHKSTEVERTTNLELRWPFVWLWPSYYSGMKLIHDHELDQWVRVLGRSGK